MEKTKVKECRTPVQFYFNTEYLVLLDRLKKNFGITRAALIRLVMRELLVTHGLLEQEKGSRLTKEERGVH